MGQIAGVHTNEPAAQSQATPFGSLPAAFRERTRPRNLGGTTFLPASIPSAICPLYLFHTHPIREQMAAIRSRETAPPDTLRRGLSPKSLRQSVLSTAQSLWNAPRFLRWPYGGNRG